MTFRLAEIDLETSNKDGFARLNSSTIVFEKVCFKGATMAVGSSGSKLKILNSEIILMDMGSVKVKNVTNILNIILEGDNVFRNVEQTKSNYHMFGGQDNSARLNMTVEEGSRNKVISSSTFALGISNYIQEKNSTVVLDLRTMEKNYAPMGFTYHSDSTISHLVVNESSELIINLQPEDAWNDTLFGNSKKGQVNLYGFFGVYMNGTKEMSRRGSNYGWIDTPLFDLEAIYFGPSETPVRRAGMELNIKNISYQEKQDDLKVNLIRGELFRIANFDFVLQTEGDTYGVIDSIFENTTENAGNKKVGHRVYNSTFNINAKKVGSILGSSRNADDRYYVLNNNEFNVEATDGIYDSLLNVRLLPFNTTLIDKLTTENNNLNVNAGRIVIDNYSLLNIVNPDEFDFAIKGFNAKLNLNGPLDASVLNLRKLQLRNSNIIVENSDSILKPLFANGVLSSMETSKVDITSKGSYSDSLNGMMLITDGHFKMNNSVINVDLGGSDGTLIKGGSSDNSQFIMENSNLNIHNTGVQNGPVVSLGTYELEANKSDIKVVVNESLRGYLLDVKNLKLDDTDFYINLDKGNFQETDNSSIMRISGDQMNVKFNDLGSRHLGSFLVKAPGNLSIMDENTDLIQSFNVQQINFWSQIGSGLADDRAQIRYVGCYSQMVTYQKVGTGIVDPSLITHEFGQCGDDPKVQENQYDVSDAKISIWSMGYIKQETVGIQNQDSVLVNAPTNAAILVDYLVDDVIVRSDYSDAVADVNNPESYTVQTSNIKEHVKTYVYINYLMTDREMGQLDPSNGLKIEVDTGGFDFTQLPISNSGKLYGRKNELSYTISDYSTFNPSWELYLVQEGPIKDQNGSIMDMSFVFVKEDGTQIDIIPGKPLLIDSSLVSQDRESKTTWGKDQGVLLKVDDGNSVRVSDNYSASFTWNLRSTK